jgi:hypothetical protein
MNIAFNAGLKANALCSSGCVGFTFNFAGVSLPKQLKARLSSNRISLAKQHIKTRVLGQTTIACTTDKKPKSNNPAGKYTCRCDAFASLENIWFAYLVGLR